MMALYDPTPKEATLDFSLADVLAWARTKPADERYRYSDPQRCAVCRFLIDTGRAQSPLVIFNEWSEAPRYEVEHEFDTRVWDAAAGGGYSSNWTFGGLVERLESALA